MKSPIRNIYELIATFFGVGKIKWAPGTFGTLAAALLYYFAPDSIVEDQKFLYLFLLVLFFIGVWVSTEAEKTMGHDNGHIVIDEVCGYWFAVVLFKPEWQMVLISFILFRIFDIFKPFPINKLQNLPKGWGVMVDDIFAGLYTAIILQLIAIVWFTDYSIAWLRF